MTEHSYPIAEIFRSVQGEGSNAGVSMAFVRMAGCSVGQAYSPQAKTALGLSVYQHKCCDWAGQGFACDTDYRAHKTMSVERLLSTPEVKECLWVCITGGEPLNHDLRPLTRALCQARKKIQVETSGTVPLDRLCGGGVQLRRAGGSLHLTMSPKHGYLLEVANMADEIKILVGVDFKEDQFEYEFGQLFRTGRIWVQPINDEHKVNEANLHRCMELIGRYPTLNLSIQIHKWLGVR
jgi:7-carboxy-7-deazaguanine synthase